MTFDKPFLLEDVADRLAIQHVIARYVHALDANEIELLDDVFMPGARFDLSSAGGPTALWPEIREYFKIEHRRQFTKDFHLFANISIELSEDHASAATRSKVINPRRLTDADGTIRDEIAVGEYHDSWVKSADGWRIAGRTWHRAFVWRASTAVEDLASGGAYLP